MTDTGRPAILGTDAIDCTTLAAVPLGFGTSVALTVFTSLTVIEAILFSGLFASLVPLALDLRRRSTEDVNDSAAEDDEATTVDVDASHVFADGATTIELQTPPTQPTDLIKAELAAIADELPTGSDGGFEDADTILYTDDFEASGGNVRLTIHAPERVADPIVEESVKSVTKHLEGESRTPKPAA